MDRFSSVRFWVQTKIKTGFSLAHSFGFWVSVFSLDSVQFQAFRLYLLGLQIFDRNKSLLKIMNLCLYFFW